MTPQLEPEAVLTLDSVRRLEQMTDIGPGGVSRLLIQVNFVQHRHHQDVLRAAGFQVTPPRDTAYRLVDEAMHLCMYGERAPGGDETWAKWAAKAEDWLRRRMCAEHGHTPDDPTCPDCRA